MNNRENYRGELDELPDNIQILLINAVKHWESFAESNKYISEALILAGEHQERVTRVYRSLFYKELRKLTLNRE
ncbi:MAG: hypothetical protein ACRCT1_19950 [Microcoleaceae cyanobacterium]